MNVLVIGYPYVRESFFNTFRFYPEQDGLFFLLPKAWKAKGGKVIFYPPKAKNIFTSMALFHHSGYPLIGGILKGWMPFLPFYFLKKSHSIDLVYNCSEPVLLTTLFNSLWAKLFLCKVVVASWENIDFNLKLRGIFGVIKRLLLKLNLWLCDGLVVGNKKGAELYARYTKKPIAVIPLNGVDPEFFRPQLDKSHRFFKSQDFSGYLIFTFIGAVDFRKGIHVLIKAFKNFVASASNARLIIAGSGDYETEIDRLLEEHKLLSLVFRYSWLTSAETRDLLSISDVFFYPSISYRGWEEQFGYSIAEASLMGLPIISTKIGSIEEVIVQGQTGFLVEENNAEELEQAMKKLAHDRLLRQQMGMAGRAFITQHFCHHIISKKFYEFFKSFFN